MSTHNGRGLDFQGLNEHLLANWATFLTEMLPDGRRSGNYYFAASIDGGQGRSLTVDTRTGSWAERNTSNPIWGGDLIDLYAEKHGLRDDIGRAAKELAAKYSYALTGNGATRLMTPRIPTPPAPVLTVPDDEPTPPCHSGKFGRPSGTWCYRNAQGQRLGYLARYDYRELAKECSKQGGGACAKDCPKECSKDVEKDKKQFMFWKWDPMRAGSPGWNPVGLPIPRPLYGLDLLAANPDAPVLIVEGEKAADAARKFAGSYVVTTWLNGSGATPVADWSVLAGRTCLLWPDADKKLEKASRGGGLIHYRNQPGPAAMADVARRLLALNCSVKILNVQDVPGDGTDAADLQFKDFNEFFLWAKPRAAAPEPAPAAPSAPVDSDDIEPNDTDPNDSSTETASSYFPIWDQARLTE